MMFNPDVYYTGRSFSDDEVKNKVIVAIDVLRAGSSIVTALQNGARGVIPVADMGDASTIAQNLDSASYLLCGERDAVKIEGYHLGNSPFEFTPDAVSKKTLIFNTTNGTRTIDRCSVGGQVFIGCFLNISAVVEKLKSVEKPVVIVCSGWKNRLSFEDLLCAGNIIHKLNDGNLPADAPDGARVAFALYEKFGQDVQSAIQGSNHATFLRGLGFEKDVAYCSQTDIVSIVPAMEDGIIK